MFWLGTRLDFTVFIMKPSETNKMINFCRSWIHLILLWFTINQSSRYITSLMFRKYDATIETIFVKTRGAHVGLKHIAINWSLWFWTWICIVCDDEILGHVNTHLQNPEKCHNRLVALNPTLCSLCSFWSVSFLNTRSEVLNLSSF